jgi:twitching motility protein PilJ
MANRKTSRRGASSTIFANGWVLALSLLLILFILLSFLSFFHAERWDGYNERFLLKAAEQQNLARQAASAETEAAHAGEAIFARLADVRDRFQGLLDDLKTGDPDERPPLPPSPAEVAPALEQSEAAWLEMREAMDLILAARDDMLGMRELARSAGDALPDVIEAMSEGAAQLADEDTSPDRILTAAEQLVLLQRMTNALDGLLLGGVSKVQAVGSFADDADRFERMLQSLIEGEADPAAERDPAVLAALRKTQRLFAPLRASADELLALSPLVQPVLSAQARIPPAGERLDAALGGLIEGYLQSPGRLRVGPIVVGPTTALVFGVLAALTLVMLGAKLVSEARTREAESKAQNEANQQAILRLLDEMGDLADGDLTVEATVTEDITGAIADSINYAVDALRGLVKTINETSGKVAASAQSTRTVAVQLAEASEVQTRQIGQATEAIKAMTQAIDEVARNATESAEVASRSLEVAGRGAQTVRDTIQGMDAIREQIQETSKRIKRLGESSQEIGEIVELIDDIADQTNILALNAAMQAAMAGEAGRGFAVVADEVQQLAERSSNATKQIDALVRTIQADTNEAVSSMEASTAGVVEGATLAENAGGALREIENVSSRIAELTRRIADSAQTQSREAGKINTTVSAIQEITERNAEGTRGTAESVEMLAKLAAELQRSVAGFRLP